ncbi:hypothetical protein QVD17_13530 [Tagetes erecta]|uniref:Uncharacterized protein n=1 Tax=Tagetes erecta TaxID=13708 RepID=A0AAD8P3C2_TARER|nr:hypothetical protein QVD17_13530 [Tagetes erecta]
MGNYMDTCIQREEKPQVNDEKVEQGSEKVKGNCGMESCRMRVKLVLTKDELEWLLLQMKNSNLEGKRLEDVLGEIEKSRVNGKKWKPSLESIIETPEVHHHMSRS